MERTEVLAPSFSWTYTLHPAHSLSDLLWFSQGPSNFKALKEANLPMWATRVALGRHGRRDSGCAVGKPVVRAQCPCGASVMSSAAGTRLKASQENHK